MTKAKVNLTRRPNRTMKLVKITSNDSSFGNELKITGSTNNFMELSSKK